MHWKALRASRQEAEGSGPHMDPERRELRTDRGSGKLQPGGIGRRNKVIYKYI